MDTQARNKIGVLKPEDWKKLGYSDSTTPNDDTEGLTNEIDPIFHYTHPSLSVPIWHPLTNAEYEDYLVDIRQMLQLASLFLRSPPSLNADYDLYYSPRVYPKKRVNFEGQPVLEFRHVETTEAYWPERRDLANAALDRLAGVVSFRVVSEKENPDMAGVIGLNTLFLGVHPRGVNIQDDTDLAKGIGSTVWIHERLITELRRLRNEKGVDNTLKVCSLTVKGAATICHELFHAKYMATDSPLLRDTLEETSLRRHAAMTKSGRQKEDVQSNEPLHEDDTDAEVGYVWEKYVFGGHIHFEGDVDKCLFFSKWPSYWASKNYHRRGLWRKMMTRYVVTMHYILNLLRQGFWDDMKEGDLTALQIKKWIGIRTSCPYSELEDPDWNINDSSEGEYPLVRPSLLRICREKAGEELQVSRANESREERIDRQLWEQTEARS
ncbi:hypothetical protein HO133_006578 [Letharia lupina]|uniref:Uncharacterized protein n=1 Tax=Letharia lupina TaxID=560253 RepID=A0A8H6C6Y0_9LECA|nr:uncharacterized protein HO133_006578 [Letharia lupina]KAF6217751.1 hypothetical protein HO133_006578 [Letharia lupina]